MKIQYPQKLKMNSKVSFKRPSGRSEVLKEGSVTSLLEHGGRFFVLIKDGRDHFFIEIDKDASKTIRAGSSLITGTVPVNPALLPDADESETSAFIAELAKAKVKPVDEELWRKCIEKAKKKFKEWPSRVASSWAVKRYKEAGGKFSGEKPERQNVKEEFEWVKGDIHHASFTLDNQTKEFFKKNPKAKKGKRGKSRMIPNERI
jgi:hypothetical protein